MKVPKKKASFNQQLFCEMGALIYNNRFLGFYSIQYLPVSHERGVLIIRGWGREISENLINREFLISRGLEKYFLKPGEDK